MKMLEFRNPYWIVIVVGKVLSLYAIVEKVVFGLVATLENGLLYGKWSCPGQKFLRSIFGPFIGKNSDIWAIEILHAGEWELVDLASTTSEATWMKKRPIVWMPLEELLIRINKMNFEIPNFRIRKKWTNLIIPSDLL